MKLISLELCNPRRKTTEIHSMGFEIDLKLNYKIIPKIEINPNYEILPNRNNPYITISS